MKSDLAEEKCASDDETLRPVSTFRRILPQFLASTAKNLLVLNLGMTIALPTIAIAALTGRITNVNSNEFLFLEPYQASWVGSVSFIAQPIGSILSGCLSEPIGRRLSMILVNIPMIAAWALLAYASNIEMIVTGILLLGLSVGLMEAPIITYVGEICEPFIRGTFIAMAGISATTGLFIVFYLGSILPWRTVAMICNFVPLVTGLLVCFIPETPIWLLSKNRTEDARKSLQWLRGWVPAELVKDEFEMLKRYSKNSKACDACKELEVPCPHPPPSTKEKIREMGRIGTRRALFLISFLFIIVHFSGMTAMRPYMVQIIDTYGSPVSSATTIVYLGLLGVIANVALMITVKWVGKRAIYLYNSGILAICSFIIGFYGYQYLPEGHKSFEKSPVAHLDPKDISVIPTILLCIMQFCSSYGVTSIPPMLLSEIFPFKSRAYAAGFVAAFSYIIAFVASKSYYNLEVAISLPGVTCLYGSFGLLGFVMAVFFLPETENRRLEDIEIYFANPNRRIFDIYIPKNQSSRRQNLSEKSKSVESISDSQTYV